MIAAVLIALYRWLLSHPARLYGFKPAESKLAGQSHWEALVILFLIFGLMVTDFLYDAARFAIESDPLILSEKRWAVIGSAVGSHECTPPSAHSRCSQPTASRHRASGRFSTGSRILDTG